MIITRLRRCPLYFRFYPTARIQVKYMSVVEVYITFLFPAIVVTLQSSLKSYYLLRNTVLMHQLGWLSAHLEGMAEHLQFVETPKTIFFLKL